MLALGHVDKIELLVIVDNTTDSLSSVPSYVETEFAALGRRRHGKWVLAGRCLCCAAHGLSCLITVHKATSRRTLLFDTGPEDRTFEQNVSRLGVDLAPVEAIVLSHGHWDHGGAALRALDLVRDGGGKRDIPYYAHPDMFRTRAFKQGGAMVPMQDVPSISELTAHGAHVVNTTEPQLILNDTVYVSGEIPRVTSFERGLPGQHRMAADGQWEPDPLVMDERFVAASVGGKGLVIFTACSHAGLINVLKHAEFIFPDTPIYAVVGGFHLAGANEQIIPETVALLRGFDPKIIAPAHCTGWRAVNALVNTFGEERVAPMAVGKRFVF